MSLPEYIGETRTYLHNRGIPHSPEAAVILGSGLGGFADHMQEAVLIPYADIPHFPLTSVRGHAGVFITGKVSGKSIIAFSGRFHHYEGFTFEQTVFPVYLAKALGAKKLIISNAAGAINTAFKVGDLMIIDDIIRRNLSISPFHRDRYHYNHYASADRTHKLAAELGLAVRRGTYLYAKGPNYETKAEIRAFRIMGADAVGMSTAPELVEAARLGLKSVGISLISNMAAGAHNGKLSHDEVAAAAEHRREDFAKLVNRLVERL